jgi:hypothetical protein
MDDQKFVWVRNLVSHTEETTQIEGDFRIACWGEYLGLKEKW